MEKIDLSTLQQCVEKMLDGEEKRRGMALKFAKKVEEVVTPVCPTIFSLWDDRRAIVFLANEPGTTYPSHLGWESCLYFRWDSNGSIESPGFHGLGLPRRYAVDDGSIDIASMQGPTFWWAIRCIVEWLPKVAAKIDEKETSREKLLSLLK